MRVCVCVCVSVSVSVSVIERVLCTYILDGKSSLLTVVCMLCFS